MVLVLVARLAFAEEPDDVDTGDATGAQDPAPAPPPAAPVFDVIVVKKGAPGGTITPAAAPGATTPSAAPVFDVTVVRPAAPAPAGTSTAPTTTPPRGAPPATGGDITPPRTPTPAVVPPPPREAPAAVPSLSIPAPPRPPPPPPVAGVGLRVEGDPAGRWRLYDAADHRYTSVQFARIVGDKEMLRRLDNEREFGKIGQIAVGVGGGALLLAGLVVVLGDVGVPNVDDYSVDPTNYTSEASYMAAADFERGQYDKALASWQSQRLGTTLFLVGSGGVALASAPFVGRDSDAREDRPHLVYSHARAAELVAAYNTAHLPPAAAPPLAAPAPIPDDDGQPPVPQPPPGSARATPPPESRVPDRNEGVPDERTFDDLRVPSGLHLRPLLGPAWVGVTGRF